MAFALDETKSRNRHPYITVFIDLDRTEKPVVFAVAGKGQQTLKAFKDHLIAHGGKAEQVVEVVSDMSGAYIFFPAATLPPKKSSARWR